MVGVSNIFKLLRNLCFALSKSGDKTLREGKHIQKIHGIDLESGALQKSPKPKQPNQPTLVFQE